MKKFSSAKYIIQRESEIAFIATYWGLDEKVVRQIYAIWEYEDEFGTNGMEDG